MSFFKSPLVRNLENGNLPTINTAVAIDSRSLINLGATLVMAAALIMLAWYAFKKLA